MSNKPYIIDLWRTPLERLDLQQYEDRGRVIEFQILDDSQEYDLTGKAVEFHAVKPDGNLIGLPCVVVDPKKGRCNYKVTEQTVILDGALDSQLVITTDQGKEITRTRKLPTNVLPSTHLDGAATSISEWETITDAVKAALEAQGKALECQLKACECASNAKVSEDNAKASEGQAVSSEGKAKQSETNAKASETNAKTSETNAKASENKAKTSETNAKASETNAKSLEMSAKQSAERATQAETSANDVADKVKASETNAKASEDSAKASERQATASKDSAIGAESRANTSSIQAANSAKEAKASETNAKASENKVKEVGENLKNAVQQANQATATANSALDGANVANTTANEALDTAKTLAEDIPLSIAKNMPNINGEFWHVGGNNTGVKARGEKGEKGDTGERGQGITPLGAFDDVSQLPNTGNKVGDCYFVDTRLYIWSGAEWEDAGELKGEKGEKGDTGTAGKDGTTAELVTNTVKGLMSPADKIKLDKLKNVEVVNNLNSDSASSALSAGMGKKLHDSTRPINALNSDSTDKPLSASMGKSLNDKINNIASTIAPATETTDGLMSSTDKTKLNGLTQVQVTNNLTGTSGTIATSENMARTLNEKIETQSTILGKKISDVGAAIKPVTETTNGLMSSADKVKLNGLKNVNVIDNVASDSATDALSAKQGKLLYFEIEELKKKEDELIPVRIEKVGGSQVDISKLKGYIVKNYLCVTGEVVFFSTFADRTVNANAVYICKIHLPDNLKPIGPIIMGNTKCALYEQYWWSLVDKTMAGKTQYIGISVELVPK